MPTTELVEVSKLNLDLKNFRTTPQKNEPSAIKAMISIKPERFFAVMDSIIEDGYLLTENIIVLRDDKKLIVKEGNRRIAILKILHNIHKADNYGIPDSLKAKIDAITSVWKKDNAKVPCTIYDIKEADKVDRIVTLAHGKGEKASRDPWNSVARARHNRDVKKGSEPALDLLEKYLKHGQNLNPQQRDRWGGEYYITILDEAMRKIYPRFGVANTVELATKYPKVKYVSELEELIRDIGLEIIGFNEVRDAQYDFALKYGINPVSGPQNAAQNASGKSTQTNPTKASSAASNPTSSKKGSASQSTTQPKAVAINDPKNVKILLKKFTPRGKNREKVVTLKDELLKLTISDNPIAFCFILRSMFEISAVAYCKDHSINLTKSKVKNNKTVTTDKTLVELLREVTNHLTNNKANKAKVKVLQGAIGEIGNPDRILSVTSMNQLVHNPKFSVLSNDICVLFGNIFPLLEEMN